MEGLVLQSAKGEPVTTSMKVAAAFNKRHDNVIQDIQTLSCSPEFNLLNFQEISYSDSMNRIQRGYEITKDGFAFLAMGFRGKKAAAFKEKFINEFNKREAIIKNGGLSTAPMNAAEMKLQVFRMLEEEASSLRHQNFLLSSAKELLEVEKDQLTTTVKKLEPKARVFDLMNNQEDKYTTDSIAHELGISSARKFNEMLQKDGIIKWDINGKKWMLRADYRGNAFTIDEKQEIPLPNGGIKLKYWMYWTGPGRIFLHQKYNPKAIAS